MIQWYLPVQTTENIWKDLVNMFNSSDPETESKDKE